VTINVFLLLLWVFRDPSAFEIIATFDVPANKDDLRQEILFPCETAGQAARALATNEKRYVAEKKKVYFNGSLVVRRNLPHVAVGAERSAYVPRVCLAGDDV
jgi:hypothetical protein